MTDKTLVSEYLETVVSNCSNCWLFTPITPISEILKPRKSAGQDGITNEHASVLKIKL